MSIIEDIKALAEDVRVGRITSYTVHELAALARKLIEEIEHGHSEVASAEQVEEIGVRSAGTAEVPDA